MFHEVSYISSKKKTRRKDLGIGGRLILKWILTEILSEVVDYIQLTQDRSLVDTSGTIKDV